MGPYGPGRPLFFLCGLPYFPFVGCAIFPLCACLVPVPRHLMYWSLLHHSCSKCTRPLHCAIVKKQGEETRWRKHGKLHAMHLEWPHDWRSMWQWRNWWSRVCNQGAWKAGWIAPIFVCRGHGYFMNDTWVSDSHGACNYIMALLFSLLCVT